MACHPTEVVYRGSSEERVFGQKGEVACPEVFKKLIVI
jgi:hypothetical protein